MEASRRQPAYESGHASGGSQQATASGREQEASRRKSAGGRWMPAGDSKQARVDMLEVEANRQQLINKNKKPAGDCHQPGTVTEPQDRQRLLRDHTVVDLCINLVFKVHL